MAELRGHGEDVRGVAVAGPHGLATTSRDGTLRLWPPSPRGVVTDCVVFAGHTNYVGPVAWAPPGALAVAPDGALVTGSRDTTVIVWHTASAQPLQRLAGHTQQACGCNGDFGALPAPLSPTPPPALTPSQVAALAVTTGGAIVSGDLGGEIRVWKDGVCAQVRRPSPSRSILLHSF